jgi:hypothetical protein
VVIRSSVNICHFEGVLSNYSVSTVGDDHRLGKGTIQLVETPPSGICQEIAIVAWYDVAERLAEVPIGSWIKVLSSYHPNDYNGMRYPQFTVYYFSNGEYE